MGTLGAGRGGGRGGARALPAGLRESTRETADGLQAQADRVGRLDPNFLIPSDGNVLFDLNDNIQFLGARARFYGSRGLGARADRLSDRARSLGGAIITGGRVTQGDLRSVALAARSFANAVARYIDNLPG